MALVEASDYEAELIPHEVEGTDEQTLLNEILLHHHRQLASSSSKLVLPIQVTPISEANLMELRSLNSVLFPMTYQEKYYREVLAADSLARIVSWNGEVVGTFSCRIQAYYVGEKPLLECYIMTFGVLAPFRRRHIGSLMLHSIIAYYKRKPEIRRITLHVHSVNEIALAFYQKFGFTVLQKVPNYYKKLEPQCALILALDLSHHQA